MSPERLREPLPLRGDKEIRKLREMNEELLHDLKDLRECCLASRGFLNSQRLARISNTIAKAEKLK